MSDGYASDESGRNMRIRFTDDIAEDSAAKPSSSSQSPLGAAKNYVDAHAATLQPKLATIVVEAAADYLSQRASLFYKQKTLDKMKNDADLIPRSAKIGLTLKARPEVKKGQEYQSLAAEAADVVIEYQRNLKNWLSSVRNLPWGDSKSTSKSPSRQLFQSSPKASSHTTT